MRLGLILAGLASLVLAIGFVDQAAWATDLWPWEVSRLSYVFIASILAAIAVPVIWIGISGETAAMAAGAIDLAITYAGAFVYLLTIAGDEGQPSLWPYVVVFGIGAVAMVVTFLRTRRLDWRDPRAMPGPVRASFAAFAVMLVAAGVALVLGADIFPWELGDETSVLFGLIYLGAAAYFVYGFLVPVWSNAAGQLAGFLAYDLVLIGPFADRFDEVSGGELISLVVYTACVVYSGALAVHYLFISAQTRLELAR